MTTLLRDLRYGSRTLARNPGFAAIAILTLALGIGANTAIFSMLNGILLRALPYPEPQRLYSINEVVPQWGAAPADVAGGNFLAWRRNCTEFSAIALLETDPVDLKGAGPPRQVLGARVSTVFFPMFGIKPSLGRLFRPQEDAAGRNHEVILTHELWARDFRSDPGVIGKPVDLNGIQFTVVGVLPPSFRYPKITGARVPAFFEPLGLGGGELRQGFSMHNFQAIARLAPGVNRSQALAQLDSVEARIAKQASGGKYNLYAALSPLKTAIVGPAQQALWMLTAAAVVVLLIICVNLANLMLVKNTARSREVAVRSALGATRGRLARQLLAEAFILAAAGGALGLLLADWGLQLLVQSAPIGIPRVDQVRIDPRVLIFTLITSVVAALLFALLPALRLARISPAEALKSAGPTTSGARQNSRLRSGLVVGEIALCAVLLAGAVLLIKSLSRVVKANGWMDEQHVLTVNVMAPPSTYGYDGPAPVGERERFYRNVRQKVAALPGVNAAGLVSTLPLEGDDWGDGVAFQEAPRPDTETPIGGFRFVSPGYFHAIGLPLLKGRLLAESDRGENVALISESVARSMLPGRDPIGMHVHSTGGDDSWLRVIGMVADSRTGSDKPPTLGVYEPLWKLSRDSESLVVRTAMDPRAIAGAIRRAIANVSPEAAVSREQTLRTLVEGNEAPRRYETSLGALFALIAVFLAALGLYGVISCAVSQRTHEIGIRMALGARRNDILRMVLGNGIKLVIVGAGAGIGAALILTRFLQSMLFGVQPADPGTFAAVALVLLIVAFLATYIPARRATKVDPMVALRYE
ncbi:MAG: ABC transporter permease [Terriglobia bacterium]